MDLRQTCINAVGKQISFLGYNGDEFSDKYGQYISGIGLCTEQHDSHGLCIGVKINDDLLFVDPIKVVILSEV